MGVWVCISQKELALRKRPWFLGFELIEDLMGKLGWLIFGLVAKQFGGIKCLGILY